MSLSLSPILNGYQSFLASGLPNNGGNINTYLAGSSTPVTTYINSAGTPNANPIVLTTGGWPPQEIWLTDGVAVKFVITDASSNILQTFDNISSINSNVALVNNALATSAQIVGSLTALRALLKTGPSTNAIVTGYNAQGLGRAGEFFLDSTDTTSTDDGVTLIVATDGGRWKLVPVWPSGSVYQALPNGRILDPHGAPFVVRGVSMFDYLFVSYEARSDYRFRQTGTLPGGGVSLPTYYARLQYINENNVKTQLSTAKQMGVNLIRVAVEPAVFFASTNYVDPSDGKTYPPDFTMLDVIIRNAAYYGIVVQLQNGNDNCPVAYSVTFMQQLAARYFAWPNVWICPANEFNGMANGGANVNNTAMWQTAHDSYMVALRGAISGQATGVTFKNPVVIGPTGYANNLNALNTILTTDTNFTTDPNLIIGIHQYQSALTTSNFRTTDLAAATTNWAQYIGTGNYCIFIDEVGINNFGANYDPNLNFPTPSVNLTYWANMQAWAIDFLDWVWDTMQFSGVAGCCGTMWNAYVPGLSLYDYNSMHQASFAVSTWGSIYKLYYLQHSNRVLDSLRGLGVDYASGAWSTGSIQNGAIINAKAGFAWTAFTPSVTSGTGTITTVSATGQYMVLGHIVFFEMTIIITTNGTGATSLLAGLPTGVAAAGASAAGVNTANAVGVLGAIGSGSASMTMYTPTGTYPGGSGSSILVSGFYSI